MKTMISVIIQTRGTDMINMRRSVSCFQKQTHKQKELILVVDNIFTKESYSARLKDLFDDGLPKNIHIFSNLNSDFVHNNVSAMRNFGAKQAQGEYILFMDDDEDIYADYLTKNIEYWTKLRRILSRDFVLTPTLMYRHSGEIQNQGFSRFNFWSSRPVGCVLGQRDYARIQMYSGNSLFAPAHVFQENPMDERFDFIYEDLAYTYFLHTINYPIIVTSKIKVYHMERDKTKLEHAWIGNPVQAYKKAKHRMYFVRKFANKKQLFQFFLIGFLGQPLRLSFKLLLNKGESKFKIFTAIWRGTFYGFRG